MEKNTKNRCLDCGNTAGRYMLASEDKYGTRWGWFCLKCHPHKNIGKEWELITANKEGKNE
jgi:hypothetical protein